MNSEPDHRILSLSNHSSSLHFRIHNALKIVDIQHNCPRNIFLTHCSPDPASYMDVIGFRFHQNPQISQRVLENSAGSEKLSGFGKPQRVLKTSAGSGKLSTVGKSQHVRGCSANPSLLNKCIRAFSGPPLSQRVPPSAPSLPC